ncbi:MAG TPA: type VI secretion system tip protein VgrG [Desulfobacterales bacterium]|nr:type VI secretion system tip protein VgrG [Desulfobacterales bacterium]
MLTQENKLFSIETPLGTDVLLLARLRGREGLSELFQFEIDLFSEQQTIALEDIVGKNVTISIFLADGGRRYLNGLISRFGQEHGSLKPETELQSPYYSATMVPWFWLLTKNLNCRIFQNLSTPDIVKKIFAEQGLTDFKLDLQSKHDPRDYTVQYRESDFDFVSRLLEDEGIYYFFTHEKDKHIMILTDHPGANAPCPGQESAKFKLSGGEYFGKEDQISSLKMVKEMQANKYSLNDYNYETPNTDLVVTSDTTHVLGAGKREKYDYPGAYASRNMGDKLATLRMEEEEVRITTLKGSSDCRAFASGSRFKLENTSRDDWDNKEYLLTRIHHKADQADSYFGASSAGKEPSYRNHFVCIPHDVPYRPARRTKRPVVDGVQTAIVVGPAGEEIYTDDYGRVKVQFHWDREGKANENSSCWIRVGQTMAGNGWGTMFLPRVGHEVIVEFIEGNPDRPIITGQVYHGINHTPYPGEKTKSTFKSNSSPDGFGFNEIRFEDKKDDEQLFIHCEKDQDIRTKNDRREWVGNDSHLIVVQDQLEKTEGDKHLTVAGDHNEKVDGTISLEAGMDMQEKVGMKHALDAGQEIHLKAGMKVILEANTQISLKVGSNFIDISPAGVSIQGNMVMINSGGSAGAGSGASPEAPRLPCEADDADPGIKAQAAAAVGQTKISSPPPLTPQAKAFKDAAEAGTPLCDT